MGEPGAARGSRALKTKRRGRPSVSRLAPYQAATTKRRIIGSCPDQLRLPFALWTREGLKMLLDRKFRVRVSVSMVGRHLWGWGLALQRPERQAFEQDIKEVRGWQRSQYPAIRRQAKELGGRDLLGR